MSRLGASNKAECASRFVYPDDASDIKRHRFFDRIAWDRHHLTRPPFVPDVDRSDDTKYFDGEDSISDLDDETSLLSENNVDESDALLLDPSRSKAKRNLGVDGQQDRVSGREKERAIIPIDEQIVPAGNKANKRPRDKVLRDKGMARQVLEVRKKGVFIGYTYRRPPVVGASA